MNGLINYILHGWKGGSNLVATKRVFEGDLPFRHMRRRFLLVTRRETSPLATRKGTSPRITRCLLPKAGEPPPVESRRGASPVGDRWGTPPLCRTGWRGPAKKNRNEHARMGCVSLLCVCLRLRCKCRYPVYGIYFLARFYSITIVFAIFVVIEGFRIISDPDVLRFDTSTTHCRPRRRTVRDST